MVPVFFFSSRRRHTRWTGDWSSDVCSSDLCAQREAALRTALGASAWQLSRQLLTESMLLSLAGGAVGLVLAMSGLRALMALVSADLGVLREGGLNGAVLAFAAAVCSAAGIMCDLASAR